MSKMLTSASNLFSYKFFIMLLLSFLAFLVTTLKLVLIFPQLQRPWFYEGQVQKRHTAFYVPFEGFPS